MAKGGFRGGFPGGGNQMNMVRQAQKMQQELLKMQQEIETSKFEFTAGGGAVGRDTENDFFCRKIFSHREKRLSDSIIGV